MYQWFFRDLQFDNYTLDLDSSVLTRYGDQEGARVGYNAKKPGRKSHHPLMAFVADCRMVANLWLRSGNAHSANNLFSLFGRHAPQAAGQEGRIARGATAVFTVKRYFGYLEEREEVRISYIIAARLYPPVQKEISRQRVWLKLDDGIEVGETQYQGTNGSKARRMVMVRQQIQDGRKRRASSCGFFRTATFTTITGTIVSSPI